MTPMDAPVPSLNDNGWKHRRWKAQRWYRQVASAILAFCLTGPCSDRGAATRTLQWPHAVNISFAHSGAPPNLPSSDASGSAVFTATHNKKKGRGDILSFNL